MRGSSEKGETQRNMRRRAFIKAGVGMGAATCLFGPQQLLDSLRTTPQKLMDICVVKNGSPAALVRQAIAALGGMSKYVSKGDVVVVKPNIGWDRTQQQAANTHPDVVAELTAVVDGEVVASGKGLSANRLEQLLERHLGDGEAE